MNNLDIILLAAIAAFILGRLWLVLGRRNDDEPERPNPFAASLPGEKDEEDVMVLPKSVPGTEPPVITPEGHAVASLAGALDLIRETDPAFDEKTFLQGAKTAFTIIVETFAKGDLSPVSAWLAPSVRESFEKAVAARKEAGETLEAHIERIADADIARARLEDSRAFLTVDFTSHQTNVVRNAAGQIVLGAPGQTEEIRDTWTFARDLKSDDPNWQLVETQA
ncbi:MAG: Tim44/TimA family putative adaptor protein [Alphaproteobacteria bacterium]|nr:Tim44/TimA family putative adaptor protein [Alphaproteobacteria bacterium]